LVLVETLVENTSEFLALLGRKLIPVVIQEVEQRPRVIEATEALVPLELQYPLEKIPRPRVVVQYGGLKFREQRG
jgi:hypothetical protein